MRKSYILYLSLFTFLFSLLLTSCHDDLTEAGASEFDLTRGYTAEQIQSQRLGYAYNAAGNVMDDSSFSVKPVINMDRLRAAENDYGLIINTERRHYTSMDIFSGNTLQELGHQETKYTIDDDEAIGSGKYYRNNSTTYRGEWHNSYKAHLFIKHIMGTTTIDAGLLRCLKLDELNNAESVLEADFRNAVADLVKNGEGGVTADKATKFAETYGTHLVVSSNIGGMLELQMEIQRDSTVDRLYATQLVCEDILGEQIVKSSKSQVISQIDSSRVEYHGQVSVKGGTKADRDKLHRTFDDTKAEEVKIADGDYYGWANRVSMDPENYNATFIGGRYLPLYELFENTDTRRALRRAYELYMKQEAPTQEVYEPEYGVLPIEDNYGPDVRVASVGTDIATPHSDQGSEKAAIICQEYVPSIRSDKPCIVVYPLLRGTDGNVRPFLTNGMFVGDESHRPGTVKWRGSASIYTPSDSIFYESDSTAIRELFDEKTHALKQVYFYWNDIHEQPNPTADKSPKAYTTTVFNVQPKGVAAPTTVAKVASTFWSVRPVALDSVGSIHDYWKTDSMFKQLYADRYTLNKGDVYIDSTSVRYLIGKDSISPKYTFCLLDGGDNFKRVGDVVDDNDGNKRWTDAVSQSMKALELNDWLPTVEQSKSITKMLGNRMSIFYSHEYDGRNMLGLDWPTGYWVISHPSQVSMATTFTRNDGQGMPIITNDVGQVRVMRLSGSGTDLLLDFPEYVRAFNYSDQTFFKYFPIYITVETF